jgi:hypothetical protein
LNCLARIVSVSPRGTWIRLTIVSNKGDTIILTITVAALRHDKTPGLDHVHCYSALRIGKALFLVIVSDTAIVIDIVAGLALHSIGCWSVLEAKCGARGRD